jgi:hypothetical protein
LSERGHRGGLIAHPSKHRGQGIDRHQALHAGTSHNAPMRSLPHGRHAALRRARACMAFALPCALALWVSAPAAAVERKQTVCTITVNSADEKEAFRRHLPASKYDFVELVEKDRPDWLGSACRAAVACDVLVVSGHFDGDNEFFSDQIDIDEYLTVGELERVSCSNSCPALFSHLKEVYLFGCNTLNPAPQNGISAEVVRNLVRDGRSRDQAQRELQGMRAGHGESSRDRMRQIFKDVPVIYGFSSTAPLGPIAGSVLNHYFRSSGIAEVGRGRVSSRLLAEFSPYGMAATLGMTDQDRFIAGRRDMCQFADDRLTDATRLAFVHQVLQRDVAEARFYLDRMQQLMASLDATRRAAPALAQVLEQIARDEPVRERFLDYARHTDPPGVRVSMIDLAQQLGWLDSQQRRHEIALMLGEWLSRPAVGVPEINLACTLNARHQLDEAFAQATEAGSDDLPHAALRACLGSASDRERTLAGLLSTHEADVQMAQAYLRHRPITDAAEMRRLTAGVVAMPPSDAQARALDTLARHYVSDPQVLEMLTRLFAQTSSWSVQAAVASVLLRADRRALPSQQLIGMLLEKRLQGPPGGDIIDALIRRLQLP